MKIPWQILVGAAVAVLAVVVALFVRRTPEPAPTYSAPKSAPTYNAPKSAPSTPEPPTAALSVSPKMWPVDAGPATPPVTFVEAVAQLQDAVKIARAGVVEGYTLERALWDVKLSESFCPAADGIHEEAIRSGDASGGACKLASELSQDVAGVRETRKACDEFVACDAPCRPKGEALAHCDKSNRHAEAALKALRKIGVDPFSGESDAGQRTLSDP